MGALRRSDMSCGNGFSHRIGQFVPAIACMPLDMSVSDIVTHHTIGKVREPADLITKDQIGVERGPETGRKAGSLVVEANFLTGEIQPCPPSHPCVTDYPIKTGEDCSALRVKTARVRAGPKHPRDEPAKALDIQIIFLCSAPAVRGGDNQRPCLVVDQ